MTSFCDCPQVRNEPVTKERMNAITVLIRKMQFGHGLSDARLVDMGCCIRLDTAARYARVLYYPHHPAYLIIIMYLLLCRLLVQQDCIAMI